MANVIIEELQTKLRELETKHKNLEVTMKKWNEKRRHYQNLMREAEQEMLTLRIEAWRLGRDIDSQIEINF
jgi:septal ring factor EnvC (AmiA/AmiB activator)